MEKKKLKKECLFSTYLWQYLALEIVLVLVPHILRCLSLKFLQLYHNNGGEWSQACGAQNTGKLHLKKDQQQHLSMYLFLKIIHRPFCEKFLWKGLFYQSEHHCWNCPHFCHIKVATKIWDTHTLNLGEKMWDWLHDKIALEQICFLVISMNRPFKI